MFSRVLICVCLSDFMRGDKETKGKEAKEIQKPPLGKTGEVNKAVIDT